MTAIRGARPVRNKEISDFHFHIDKNNLKTPSIEEYADVWKDWINYSDTKSLKGLDNFKIENTKYKYPDKKNRNNFIREFLDSIIDNKPTYPSKKDIFNLMTACFYADLSARHGKEINIKYFND